MQERKKLSDILHGSDRDKLAKAWTEAKAADDFSPLPSGEYVAIITDGACATAKSGTLGYKLSFQVCEGEHAGRRFWHDIWLTEAAMSMAKRDLGKLGIQDLDQLDRPLPVGIRCRVKLTLRKDDSGAEFNRVRAFEVIGIDPPDPFAPADSAGPPSDDGPQPIANGGAKELFPFGANAAAVSGPYAEGR